MSKADDIFIKRCKEIISEGVSDSDGGVRPVWEDGTPAHTIKKFGVVNEYNLQEEFPIMTLRRTALKSAVDEMLWIYQKKSNNVNDLNSHIWDQWADKSGSIGKAYGYQIGKKYLHHKEDYPDLVDIIKNPDNYPKEIVDKTQRCLSNKRDIHGKLLKGEEALEKLSRTRIDFGHYLDQMDGVLYDLKNNPNSRRIITNMYNLDELNDMHLYPCAYSTTWNVTGDTLNLLLNQRSQDMLTASNWNVCQYAILLMMVSQVSGFKPGKLTHVIADCHIYDRHIPLVKELIENPTFDAPFVTLNPRITDFYDFTTDDVIMNGYKYSIFDHKIEVAI